MESAQRDRIVLSIEPFIAEPEGGIAQLDEVIKGFDWIIVGGLTGTHKSPAPYKLVACLVAMARSYGIPVYVKANAGYPNAPHEYPEGVPHDEG